MKKLFLSVAILCGLITLGSCADELELDNMTSETITPQGKMILKVGMPDDDSRVAYDDNKLQLTWEEDDQLVVIAYSEQNDRLKPIAYKYFNLIKGAGTKKGEFSGDSIPGATHYEVGYGVKDLNGNISFPSGNILLNNQVQAGNNSTAHLKNTLRLTSDTLTTEELNSNFSLKMRNSFLKVKMNALPDKITRLNQITWTTNGGTADANSIEMVLKEVKPGAITAYMCFDPAKMNIKTGGRFDLQLISGCNIYAYSVMSEKGKTYKSGTRYTLQIDKADQWKKTQISNDEIWVKMKSYKAKQSTKDYTLQSEPNEFGFYVIKKNDGSPIVNVPAEILAYNDQVKNVILPASVKTIGPRAFSFSQLSYISLPEKLEKIGDSAFDSCNELTIVDLPEGLKEIDQHAFRLCMGLTSVQLPESLSKMGNGVFINNSNLLEVKMPHHMAELPDSTFLHCSHIQKVDLPDNLTTVGLCSFYNCEQLASINLPATVNHIKDFAFTQCASLNSIKLPENSGNIKLGNYAFMSCYSLSHISLPASVTEVGQGTFSECSNLERFDGACSLISADRKSLMTNGKLLAICPKNLSSIDLPEGLVEIAPYTFAQCMELTSVKLPMGLQIIGDAAFYSCIKLKEITIPSSVTQLGKNIFFDCNELEKFSGQYASKDGRYLVKDNHLMAFAPKNLKSTVVPDGVTEIPSSFFYYSTLLEEIKLPTSLRNINEGAFAYCTGLKQIIVPEGVTTLGNQAFYNCSMLSDVQLPSTLQEIGFQCFFLNSKLESIVLPKNMTKLGANCFYDCNQLKSVTVLSPYLYNLNYSNYFPMKVNTLRLNAALKDEVIFLGPNDYAWAVSHWEKVILIDENNNEINSSSLPEMGDGGNAWR